MADIEQPAAEPTRRRLTAGLWGSPARRRPVLLAVLVALLIGAAQATLPVFAAEGDPPSNDARATALTMTGDNGSTTGTNVGATTEADEPATTGPWSQVRRSGGRGRRRCRAM